ncbi:MAG: hypothetical protein ACJ8FS_16090 [Sphingomicrobium sp.]
MADNEVLVNTDVSFERPEITRLARAQYQYREFSFWTDEAIDRSVNRYQQSLWSDWKQDWKPDLASYLPEAVIEPLGLRNRRDEPALELPAVFQKRVIGERSVSTLQEWECAIIEIKDDTVHALATSVIAREPDQNYIEIPLFEFQPSDRAKLRAGVVFRLIIGFVMKPNGQRSREAILYIRHQLPRSEKDVDKLLDLLVDE